MIINELIDIYDGGFSGVIFNGLIEFSHNNTPRCVDKGTFCSMPLRTGLDLMTKILDRDSRMTFERNNRIEFSFHPREEGILLHNFVIWDLSKFKSSFPNYESIKTFWPNPISELVGDKVFGLFLANSYKYDVPFSKVTLRDGREFSFGKKTSTLEQWTRSCPANYEPGKLPTKKGQLDFNSWFDEYSNLSSVIIQDSVESEFSGCFLIESNSYVVEGVKGFGDRLMNGTEAPQPLPEILRNRIEKLAKKLLGNFGPARVEWAADKEKIWILQVNLNQIKFKANEYNQFVIYNQIKKISNYIEFKTNRGLSEFRKFLNDLDSKKNGVILVGNIGVTSHFGDLLRRKRINSYIRMN